MSRTFYVRVMVAIQSATLALSEHSIRSNVVSIGRLGSRMLFASVRGATFAMSIIVVRLIAKPHSSTF